MNCAETNPTIGVTPTTGRCPLGEKIGKKNMRLSKIPVLTCEGPCIRGEIARVAANIIAKGESYERGCHGELLTVPQSAIAHWIKRAEKVVLIDGCFMRCHGRMFENLIDADKLIQFDALSHHKKYTDIFDPDDVPEDERQAVAQSVANWVSASLDNPCVEKARDDGKSSQDCNPCCDEQR